MSVRIREATADDARAIAEINVDAWREAYGGVVSDATLEAMSPDRIEASSIEALADPDGRWRSFVATGGDDVIGYVSFGEPREGASDLPGAGEIYAIYVRPQAWGTGAGRALFAAAREALGEVGCARGFLWVLEENRRARRFYEIAGWRWDGTRSDHQVECDNLPIVRYVGDL